MCASEPLDYCMACGRENTPLDEPVCAECLEASAAHPWGGELVAFKPKEKK